MSYVPWWLASWLIWYLSKSYWFTENKGKMQLQYAQF